MAGGRRGAWSRSGLGAIVSFLEPFRGNSLPKDDKFTFGRRGARRCSPTSSGSAQGGIFMQWLQSRNNGSKTGRSWSHYVGTNRRKMTDLSVFTFGRRGAWRCSPTSSGSAWGAWRAAWQSSTLRTATSPRTLPSSATATTLTPRLSHTMCLLVCP